MNVSNGPAYRQPRQLAAASRPSTLGMFASVWPALILSYSFLLFPIEVMVTVAGLNLYSYRIAILLLAPFAIFRVMRSYVRLEAHDFLIAIGCFWIIISFVANYAPVEGLIRSSAIFIDTFGSYLIARASIRSFRDIRLLLIALLPGLVIAGGFLALESLSKQLIVRPFFRSIFGAAVLYEGGVAKGALEFLNEQRLGLRRAYSVFSFPILGGVILSSLLTIYVFSGIRGWPRYLGIAVSCAAIFSVSSAVFAVLIIAVALMVLDRLLVYLRPLTWVTVSWLVGFYFVIANFIFESGVVGVIGRFTLNPATAYVRRLQWSYGSESIAENPLVGIGLREYERAIWMTPSIDAHFLSLGVRHGLVTPLLMLASILLLMIKLGRQSNHLSKADRDLALGINLAIGLLVFSSMTVTYFGESNIWFMLVLGVGAAAASVPRQVRRYVPRAAMSARLAVRD